MKIAIISSSFLPVIDGVTIAVYYRIKQLSKLGHQVILFCPSYQSLSNIYPNWQEYTGQIFPQVEVISLPSTNSIALDFERDVTSKSYQIVLEKLSKFQPDIIHVDEAERLSTCFFKIAGCDFAKSHKIPCVAFFHTNYIEYFDDYFQLPFKLNSIIKFILTFIFAKIYNSYYLTLTASKLTFDKLRLMGFKNLCCDNFLGVNLIKNQPKPKNNYWLNKYNIRDIEEKIKLIFVGRLTPDKGWNFCLKSLSKLPQEILKKIAFIIVGDGLMKDEIKQKLSQLTPHTYLLGRIDNQTMPELFANSDIFVTTSTKETRGLAVIEACAAEIPVICPDSGGVIDTIKDGYNGFLFQSNNEVDFLEKLILLVNNNSLRKSMGIKAKISVQDFTWEKTTNNLLQVWGEQIIKKK